MDRYEFETWLMDLPLQTLTEELKETILEKAEEAIDDSVINSH